MNAALLALTLDFGVNAGFGHDREIALAFGVRTFALGRAASQAQALELFTAVGAGDVEALAAGLHRPTVKIAIDDPLVSDRRVAGVIPILASHRAETAVKVASAILVNKGVAADEAGDDVVLSVWASAIGYSLRHAAASMFIETLGWTPKRIQTVLGHSSITMTFDRYGHLFDGGDDQAAMKRLEAAVVAA